MSIRLEYFEEPKLQFGQYFEHEDSKTGLSEYGPFGQNIDGLHPPEIKLGFVGTRETISDAKVWIEELGSEIESEKVKKKHAKSKTTQTSLFQALEADQEQSIVRYDKILNPDFIGFNRDSQFKSRFLLNDRWNKPMESREIEKILQIEDKEKCIWDLVGLFESYIETLATTSPTPNIIIVALPPKIVEQAHSVRVSGNFHLNFRRALKARAMRWDIPLQLLQRRTVTGTGEDLQDKATRAWNFCTGQYYKADGVPWRPLTLEDNVCFVGISFYIAQDLNDKLTMRASVAQAFDHLGQGLVLRGDPFEWDIEKLGRTPHLSRGGARKLIARTLKEYTNVQEIPPKRVVIHKTSEFWGSEHPQYDEIEGFYEGVSDVFSHCETDFVALRQTGVKLFREGKYPPLRGTYFNIEDTEHFLYTMGFIPYLETSPSVHVPEPWQIVQHIGGSSPRELLREVLILTKMNVNNCVYADGTPITLSFSQKVGEIMKHIPQDGRVQEMYKFYM
jgi:hypothetical protein